MFKVKFAAAFVGAAAIASLSGCATQGGVGATAAAKPSSPAVFVPQLSESLNDAGLSNPKTVWVPSLYTKNTDALYINGQQYVSPNGSSDVAGFLNLTGGGYMVAVREKGAVGVSIGATQTMLSGGLHLVFYKVSDSGQTENSVGSLPIQGSSLVVVAPSGIYAQNIVGKSQAGSALFSYVGFNAEGRQVNGPQSVLYAAPKQDGGWAVLRVTSALRSLWNGANCSDARWVMQGKDGAISGGYESGDCAGDLRVWTQTTGMFVNEPNYAGSFRTGLVAKLTSSKNTDGIGWNLSMADAGVYPGQYCWGVIGRKCVRKDGIYTKEIGRAGGDVNFSTAFSQTERVVTFTDDKGNKAFTTQIDKSGLYAGYTSSTKEGNVDHPLFEIMPQGANVLRQFVGGNGGNLSSNSAAGYDVIGIITKNRTILYSTNNVKNEQLSVDLSTGKSLAGADISNFLAQFGVMQ